MFAVMGVTGRVGGAVVRTLLADGLPVRAIVRDAVKGEAFAAKGCEIAIGDLDNADALAAAFAGCEAAFVMLPSQFDPSPGFAEARAKIAVLREALAKGLLGKVVALSTIGANATQPNLLNQLGLMEQALSDLGLPVTFLRAAWFMENAMWDVAPARETGVIQSYLQPLDRPVPMIATDDVGRTAAELLRENWIGVRVVELEAAERVSPNAIASAFAKTLQRPVQAEIVPRADWEGIFTGQGMKNPAPRMQMLDGFNEGWIDFADRGVKARKGRISIEQAIAALVAKHAN